MISYLSLVTLDSGDGAKEVGPRYGTQKRRGYPYHVFARLSEKRDGDAEDEDERISHRGDGKSQGIQE